MGLQRFVNRLLGKESWESAGRRKRRTRSNRLGLLCESIETLESRLVLYAASGDAWPSSAVVTISFEPDGTDLGGVQSNLNQSFNGSSDLNGRWQAEILRAAQVWSQATNINFVVVADNGAASGSGKNEQGDPGFGDIRIGGYNFGNTSLAGAYMPPPDNNYSIAGDIVFNTATHFSVGKNYDLFTVAVHEFGHALGLDHTSTSSGAELWATYNGVKPSLSADDIAGIRSIYSGNAARSADDYDKAASNGTFATASDVTSQLAKTKSSAVIDDLDLTTASDVDFYQVTAPKWANDTLVVTVQSTGLSMLAPKLTVYAADQKTVLGTVSGLNQYGTTISVSIANVTSGTTYYVKVEGADSTSPFSVGSYGLILDLGAKTAPTVTPPKTTKASGRVPTSGGGAADGNGAFDEILAPTPTIETISPDTGASSTDRTTSSNKIVLNGVGSIASVVEVFQNGVSLGKTLDLLGIWSFTVPSTLSDGTYTFTARATSLLGQDLGTSDAFTVKIDTRAPDAPTLTPVDGTQASNGSYTSSPTILAGTTEPSDVITIVDNGAVLGTTNADGYGNWSYTVGGGFANGTHQISASSTDPAGNVSTFSAVQTLVVGQPTASSQNLPTISYVTKTTSLLLLSTLSVQGTTAVGGTVQVSLNGTFLGSVTANSQGNWTYKYSPLLMANGTYRFSAVAIDAKGNQAGVSNVVTYVNGSTAAAISNFALTSPSTNTSSGTLVSTSTPVITGSAPKNTLVSVYDGNILLGTVAVGTTGSWSFTTPVLAKGGHSLVAVATDTVGSGIPTAALVFQV
jgi:hypothetical protein